MLQRSEALKLTSTRSKRRAFTLMEVLIAAAIGTMFSFIVLASITSVSGMSGDLFKQSASESTGRLVVDVATRALRNAVPLYQCRDIPVKSSLATCRQLDSTVRSEAFLRADSKAAYFYSYATSRDGSEGSVPDLVTIVAKAPDVGAPNADNWSLCVNVYRWNGTDPFTAWAGTTAAAITALPEGNTPAGSSRVEASSHCVGPIGEPTADLQPLRYLAAGGTYMTAPVAVTELRSVRLVELNIALAYRTSNGTRFVKPSQVLVAVNSAVLG